MLTNSSLKLSTRFINGKKSIQTVLANHVFYYPTPSNLTYAWSFGSLSGLFFALQIVTGIVLAMHYTPHVEIAFSSVEHIMEDVNGGYLLRYFHANGASAIFILIYLHIARNLYFQSYLTRPVLWQSGLVVFLLMMATAFIGYVLPWGQMSFWGATVITSLVTAVPFVGQDIAHWIWGGFSINNATLTRFFSAHYLLPFLVTGVIGSHLTLLHTSGSSDPLTLPSTPDKLTFHPYFTYKDSFIFTVVFALFALLVAFAPNLLGHSDNFIPANPLVTPAHIVPEWYFTPFYAILRACPNKLGGAIGMFAAIVMLFIIPKYYDALTTTEHVVAPHSATHKVAFWFFCAVFLTLMFLGSRAAAAPYVMASKLFTVAYFAYFLLFIPFAQFLGESIYEKIELETTQKSGGLSSPRLVASDFAWTWGVAEIFTVVWFSGWIPWMIYTGVWGYRHLIDSAVHFHWERRCFAAQVDKFGRPQGWEVDPTVDPFTDDERFYDLYSDIWERERLLEFHVRLVNFCRRHLGLPPIPNPLLLPYDLKTPPKLFWKRDYDALPCGVKENKILEDPELEMYPTEIYYPGTKIINEKASEASREMRAAYIQYERFYADPADVAPQEENAYVMEEDEGGIAEQMWEVNMFDQKERNGYLHDLGVPFSKAISYPRRAEREMEFYSGAAFSIPYESEEYRLERPLLIDYHASEFLDEPPSFLNPFPFTKGKSVPAEIEEMEKNLTASDEFPYVAKGHPVEIKFENFYIPDYEYVVCEMEKLYYQIYEKRGISLDLFWNVLRQLNYDEHVACKAYMKTYDFLERLEKSADLMVNSGEKVDSWTAEMIDVTRADLMKNYYTYQEAIRKNPSSVAPGTRYEGHEKIDFIRFVVKVWDWD